MARVVQRRGAPPYALLLLVFLACIFLVLAVVFGSYWSDARKELARKNQETEQIATGGERNSDRVKSALAAKPGGATLVGHLLDRLAGLEKELADKTAGVDSLTATLTERDAAIAQLEARRGQLQQQCEEAVATLTEQRQRFDEEQAKTTADLTAERDRNKSLSESYDASLADARAAWNTRLEEKDRQMAAMEAQLRQIQNDLLLAETKLAEATQQLKDVKREPDRAAAPDGKILRADTQRGVAYIDAGREERVRIGATFAVYDSRIEVKPDTPPKARIVVKNVMAGISEVEIVQSTPGNPVLAGDIITNVAFDRKTSPLFVVTGSFDLDGDGNEDEHGSDAVSTMIKEYGGRIAEQVSPDVDYLVTGDAPRLPARPAPGAPPSAMQLWQDKSARLDQYRKAVDDARGFQIPVLNVNRLMVLMGRSPATTG